MAEKKNNTKRSSDSNKTIKHVDAMYGLQKFPKYEDLRKQQKKSGK